MPKIKDEKVIPIEDSKEKVEEKAEQVASLSDEDKKELLKQIDAEFSLAYDFLKPRFDKWRKNLKLYNNQKRNQKAVGENLLFTLHDTLLASLYDDRMTVTFKGREEGDKVVEEPLNLLAEFDYEEMGKAELDYDVKWDALFYSYGLIDMSGFNLKDKMPTPYLIDPGTFYFDPRGQSVSGNKQGRGAFRFCGQEIYMTKRELDESTGYFDIEELGKENNSMKSESQQLHEARADAVGANGASLEKEKNLGDNSLTQLLEWRTWFKGKRILATVGDDRTKLVRYDEKVIKDGWNIVSTHAWRKPHGFIGTSVVDLAEDKHRAMAIIMNVLLRTLKAGIEPDTLYNPDFIANKAEMMRPGGRKFIATKGMNGASLQNALMPVQQAQPNMQTISYMLDSLSLSAQKATATPEIQSGAVSKEQRTLGELNIIAQKVDTRYSLLVKNMAQGEKDFWQHWYRSYKTYFPKGVVEKIMRLDSVLNDKYRKLTKENFIVNGADPDVMVESKILMEATAMREIGKWAQMMNLIVQEPTADKRYGYRKIAEKSGLTRQEIDGLLPLTIDEMIARRENLMLNDNKMPQIRATDNHMQHLAIHKEANSTSATFAHIDTHKKAMTLQKEKPELFPQAQQPQQEGAQPQTGGQMQEANKMMTAPPSM